MPYLEDVAICTDDRPVIDFQAVAWLEGFSSSREQKGRGIRGLLRTMGAAREIPCLGP